MLNYISEKLIDRQKLSVIAQAGKIFKFFHFRKNNTYIFEFILNSGLNEGPIDFIKPSFLCKSFILILFRSKITTIA